MTASNAALHAWTQQAGQQGNYPYLLIDGAQNEDAQLWLERRRIGYESLFAGTREASLVEIAPWLIPLATLSERDRAAVIDWAADLAMQSPSVSWLESTRDVADFAAHLRLFHSVGLSDDQSMLMRWYDTRLLPVWLSCLHPEQLAQFAAPIVSLHYYDRFGTPASLYQGEGKAPLPQPLPLGKQLIALDDQQYALLMDAGTLDTLVAHLRRVITDETNLLSKETLYRFTARYQQRAIEAGIHDLDRQTQYVLLAMYTSGAGVEHPECVALMKDPPKGLPEFFGAMQALPEAAWEMGPPLWGETPDDVETA